MENYKIKGLWIPIEILEIEELTDKEKIILSIILALSSELGYCFAGNSYFAKLLNITKNRVSKIISQLKEKEYIDVKINLDERKQVKSREIRLTKKLLEGMVINGNTYCRKKQYPIVLSKNNIINKYKKYNNNITNYEQRKYTKEELEKLYINTSI